MKYLRFVDLKVFSAIVLLSISSQLHAQSPGGIVNPILWKKDWEERSQEEFGTETFNFHPFCFFNEDRGYSEIPLEDIDKISLFIVFISEKPAGIASVNTGIHNVELTDTAVVSKRIIDFHRDDKPQFISFIESMPNRNRVKRDDGNVLIGSKTIKDDWLEGGVAEVIVYDRLVSTEQRQRIESYLSIKYGVSLPETSDYFRSDGFNITDGLLNTNYKKRITGIGRDDGSDLYQKQSKNVQSDIDLTLSLGALTNMNVNNSNTLQNHSFILWSDNDKALSFDLDKSYASAINGLERKWAIDIIGEKMDDKLLTIKMNPSLIKNYDPKLDLWVVIANDDDDLMDSDHAQWFRMDKISKNDFRAFVKLDENNSGRDYFSFVQSSDENKEEDSLASQDVLFPNPVALNGEFNLKIDFEKDEELHLSVYNSLGLVVDDQILNSSHGMVYSNRINVPGSYLISVQGERSKKTYKLIVQ